MCLFAWAAAWVSSILPTSIFLDINQLSRSILRWGLAAETELVGRSGYIVRPEAPQKSSCGFSLKCRVVLVHCSRLLLHATRISRLMKSSTDSLQLCNSWIVQSLFMYGC